MSKLGLSTNVPCSSLKEAEELVAEELKKEGFGVLTEIDVTATLKKKIDVDFRPYKILGACNPTLAHKALEIAPDVGLLLPCNVVLQKQNNEVRVSIIDPTQMANVVPTNELEPLMSEAKEKLQRDVDSLARAEG